MPKQPWALILGASSGFGEATALELARAGMNIFGVHMDRRDRLPHVAELEERMRDAARKFEFEKAAQIRDRVKALREP